MLNKDSMYPFVPIALPGMEEMQMTDGRVRSFDRRFLGICVGLFIGGAALHTAIPYVLGGGAFAGIVSALALNASMAGGVGAVIELFASRQLIRAASREIAAMVLGSHLPAGFDERIREIVHGTNIVLEDWRAQYLLEPTEGDQIRVTLNHSWTAKNYGRRNEKYRTSQAEEAVYKPRFELLEVFHRSKRVPAALTPTTRETGAMEAAGPELTLTPRGSNGDSCKVSWRMTMLMPKDYTHTLAFGNPTVNPTICVVRHDGFSFSAVVTESTDAMGTTWQYRQAFLKGQHLRVWWRPLI